MLDSSRVREVFRQAGLRWTPQRQAVVEALRGSREHPTAEEILRAVRRRHPGMSRATIYNTMDVLAATGLIGTIHAERGTRRFDANDDPHHHLRCEGCGRVFDLPADRVSALPEVRDLDTPDFRITGCRIEFRGTCTNCRKKMKEDGKWQRT